MLSIKKARKLLPKDQDYSDEKVLQISDEIYKFTELMFDCWVDDQKKKTCPTPKG